MRKFYSHTNLLFCIAAMLLAGCGSGLCPLRTGAQICIANSYFEASGVIDSTFGVAGKATGSVPGGNNFPYQFALQPDGKIVAAGTYVNSQFILARFTTSGALDTSFATIGYLLYDYTFASVEEGRSLAILSNGNILLGGNGWGGASEDFIISRWLPNGTLDTSYGTGGVTAAVNFSGNDFGRKIAVQPDGKAILAGDENFALPDLLLGRFNSDGSLDTSFGGGTGKSFTANSAFYGFMYDIALQSDQKIVGVGSSFNGANRDVAIMRYNTDGTYDTSFGTSGRTVAAYGASTDELNALTIQPDGKIVAAGYTVNGGNNRILLQRYNSNGSLDTTFATAGSATNAGFIGALSSIVLQPNGRIIVGGSYYNGTDNDFLIMRFNTNGSLDTTFGTNGMITTAIGTSNDNVYSVLINSSGAIVAGGNSYNGAQYDIAVVKYK